MSSNPHCVVVALLISIGPFSKLQADSGALKIRVVDASTHQLIAARVSLVAADGSHPGDRIGLSRDKWPGLEAHGIFLSSETTLTLPAGKTFLAASRGPQYEVARREVEIVAGKSVEVELPLQRRIDLKKLGWVCGDAHLHMIHGEMQRETSYSDIAVTCRANGLDWACVNQEYGGAGELTLDGLHAECRKVSDGDFQLLLGGERPKSLLGHHALIGVTNPFIIPDDPPYHLGAKLIHDQGGVLFPVHPVRYYPGKEYRGERLDFPGNNLAREMVFDSFLGPSFDGLSVLSDEPDNRNALQLWFHLLNRGLFVPVFADSDACFDRPTLQKNVPGFWATYLHVGQDGKADGASLVKAVRDGRTMATTGPILLWDIDGHKSGDTLPADGAARRISIEAWHGHHNWTLDEARLSRIELIRNGEVIRTWEPDTADAKLTLEINETEPCWYAVRALGTDQRWQVALASPIFFDSQPVSGKRKPLTVRVRGRVYDFVTGEERPATIRVERHAELLKQFDAEGQFTVDMPLGASISAVGKDRRSISHDLLLDYGPVHRFLWNLDSEALGKRETFTQFEALVREVDLEFPLGHRMAGCYEAQTLPADCPFESLLVTAGPKATGGPVAVAAVLLDKHQAKAGDVINAAVLFHDQGAGEMLGDATLVAEGRGYDPRRPSGFNSLKVFGTIDSTWSRAESAGDGFRVIRGALKVPEWVEGGPVNALEINAFARKPGGEFVSHVGLRVPLGPTARSLMVSSNWPTVPISWPDHNYGVGPLKICGKLGRAGQTRTDYRTLEMTVTTARGDVELHPAQDCRGCTDADDAVYSGHFFDQNPGDESLLGLRDPIRAQPSVVWRELPVIDARLQTTEN